MAVYFQALGALTLQPSGWVGRMFSIANGWSSHGKYWTITFQMRIVTLIYVKLILKNMQTKLTFLLEDSLANPSALPGKEKAQMMNATCGAKCLEQFKRLNPNLSSQKMSLVSRILMADWYSSRCALTWKMKGTKFSRLLFQLQPKTHRTEEIDVGLLLKTPCSADAYTEKMSKKEQRFGNSGTLAQEVQTGFIYQRGMLPTPATRDYKGANSMEHLKGENGTVMNHMTQLPNYIKFHLGSNSQLNPRFVAEMMGFPPNWTELPFLSGETNPSKPTEMQ